MGPPLLRSREKAACARKLLFCFLRIYDSLKIRSALHLAAILLAPDQEEALGVPVCALICF
jgi:hypothetical protein